MPGERAPGIISMGGWVGLTDGLDVVEKRRSLTLSGILRSFGPWTS